MSDQETKICPFCAEPVRKAAIKCRHCGEALGAIREDFPMPQDDDSSRPGLSAVMSLVIPGAGSIYNGHLTAGLALLIGTMLGYLLIVPGLAIHIYAIYAAFKQGEAYSKRKSIRHG